MKDISNWFKLAIGIFLLAFIARLAYHSHGLWIDEGRDLDIARDILTEGKFKSGKERRPLYYASLLFFLLVTGFSTFGGQLMVILMGSLTVFLIFLIGRELYNERAGVFASALFAFQPLHWFLSTRILSDAPVTFMVALTSYLFIRAMKRDEKKTLYLSAVSLGLAALTKVNGLILTIPMGLYLIFEKREEIMGKEYLLSILIFSILFCSWFTVSYFGLGEKHFMQAPIERITKVREDPPETRAVKPDKLHYLKQLPTILGLPLTVVFLIGLFLVLLAGYKKSLYPLLWFGVFLAVSSFLSIKVPRYLLPLIPATCIIGGLGLDKIYRDIGKKEVLYLIGIAFLAIMFFQIRQGTAMISSKAEGWSKIDKAGKWLREHTSKEDEIIAASAGQMRWYTNRKCYSSRIFKSKENFTRLVGNGNVRYIEVDVWETRMREKNRKWVFGYLKEHNETFKPVKMYRFKGKPVILVYEVL